MYQVFKNHKYFLTLSFEIQLRNQNNKYICLSGFEFRVTYNHEVINLEDPKLKLFYFRFYLSTIPLINLILF